MNKIRTFSKFAQLNRVIHHKHWFLIISTYLLMPITTHHIICLISHFFICSTVCNSYGVSIWWVSQTHSHYALFCCFPSFRLSVLIICVETTTFELTISVFTSWNWWSKVIHRNRKLRLPTNCVALTQKPTFSESEQIILFSPRQNDTYRRPMSLCLMITSTFMWLQCVLGETLHRQPANVMALRSEASIYWKSLK